LKRFSPDAQVKTGIRVFTWWKLEWNAAGPYIRINAGILYEILPGNIYDFLWYQYETPKSHIYNRDGWKFPKPSLLHYTLGPIIVIDRRQGEFLLKCLLLQFFQP